MSDSPKSDKGETRFRTPAPELDDHRFQAESLPRADIMENPAARGSLETRDRPDLLPVSGNTIQERAPICIDFEHAVIDDDEDENLDRPLLSLVDVQRANTMESQMPGERELNLHRTISATSHHHKPAFSNASVVHPGSVDIRVNPTEEADVCFPPPPFEDTGRSPIIDYEELEEFVALSKAKAGNLSVQHAAQRKHSISAQSRQTLNFTGIRKGNSNVDVPDIVMTPCAPEKSNNTIHLPVDSAKDSGSDEPDDEKAGLEAMKNTNGPQRFSFFSSEFESTVHAASIGDLVLPGDSFRDLFQLGLEGGVWWLDVVNPTSDEMGAISRAFSIHPLTAEDIMTQEAREKVELFRQYYFVCFRTFYQVDKTSEDYLEPVNLYMVVFREGVISFSFTDNPHAANVRKRIGKLREYVSLSSDWICYAMIDDIVDSFGPVIREIEAESEAIEDDVYVARIEDFNLFLPKIGGLRKKVMSLMRLLGGKADVIKGFAKRCNEQYSVTPRGDIGLYLGDIQDHVVTMMSNLGHFEKMLSRSHGNYLAQVNVTNIMVGNRVNEVLSKITFLASILVPMNLICGLFGMNVHVPGQNDDNLHWFFGIVGIIVLISIVSLTFARRYKLV
ncbi:magnesium transporter ALR1 [Nannizzia gypsea CBS 118893]|uniref:Magnesium transporter ALR1 n=1 Tax=Arthroderma gypseum (strain ATCC MYA-4604 / CBS 118893) TaxID=535722 RepID=E4UU77_ARTGP|nr:magnesium transporter ALR1 [Nannizzia gypsea CBS 118893]EFR00844.1 magnesium transporter ALR1 [Nannizzia gypsea CBS 118893]